MGIFSKRKSQKYYSIVNDQIIELEDINTAKPIVNKQITPVKFLSEDGIDYLFFKEKKYQYEIVEQKLNSFQIMVEGIIYNISVENEFSLERKKMLEANKQEKNILQLTSPMPGKIINILVEEGTQINEGDSILILEAMKMQNEIIAPKSGFIKKINVKPEQNIMKDDILVIIE